MTQNSPHPSEAFRPRSTVAYLLLLPLVASPLWIWVLWEAPEELFLPLLIAGGSTLVILVVLVLVLNHRVRKNHTLQEKVDALRSQTDTLAEEELTAMMQKLQAVTSFTRILHLLSHFHT